MSEALFDPVPVPVLGGAAFAFSFAEDPNDPEVQTALRALLDPGSQLLTEAARHVRDYCEDILSRHAELYPEFEPPMKLEESTDIWSHVQFGEEITVTRRADGDAEDGIYFSIECNCDWEPEHGLQLVIRDGTRVTKVGGYDGHLTNADAHAEPAYAGIVYVTIQMSRERLASRRR
jgi:hypothetical protein